MTLNTPYTNMYFNQTAAATTANTSTATSSAGSSAAGYAGIATAVAGAYSTMVQGQIQEINFEMQEAQRKAQAAQAASMAKLNNMKLQRQYNKTASNQALIFSTQGRSFTSGSIQNILREDASRLTWDQEFMKMSGEINESSIMADASGYRIAGSQAAQGGMQKGLLQLTQAAIDYSKVK